MTELIREKLKTYGYFSTYLEEELSAIDNRNVYIEQGKIDHRTVLKFQKENLESYLHITIAQYSMGEPIEVVKQSYLQTIAYFTNHDCWNPVSTKVTYKDGSQSDQYTVDEHGIMLRLLALGVLLKVSKAEFNVLVDIIDRDNVVDNLFEYLIKSYYPERKPAHEEIYNKDLSVILKVYQKLRLAVAKAIKPESTLELGGNNEENLEPTALIKGFLQKDFYHKHSGFHNDHKYEQVKLYYGYWSFEAAAITCLMGLDDKSYRKHKYYPVDLADYYRE